MKRVAGKADPVAEVYSVVSKQARKPCPRIDNNAEALRRKFEALACFRNAVQENDETPTTNARLRAAREVMLSKFCTSDHDSEYERIHARPVTEAHHAAEEMRLPTTSARQDGGKLPPAMVCSARLP